MLSNQKNPGLCPKSEIMKQDIRQFKDIILFVGSLKGDICDIGELNAKSIYLSDHFNIKIEQLDQDFNFCDLYTGKKYDNILCFEVIEHLQNSLLFMRNIKKMLKAGGVIYLSTPSRPHFLWTPHHFIEMSREKLTQWILAPLDLKIIRSKKIRLNNNWKFYFTGIRPFLRLFFNYTNIYEIRNV